MQLNEQYSVHIYWNKGDSGKTGRISLEKTFDLLYDEGKVVIQVETCEDDDNTLLNRACYCFPSDACDGDIFFLGQKSYCCYVVGDTSFLMTNSVSSLSHNLGCMMGSVLFYDAAL